MGIILTKELLEDIEIEDYIDSILDDEFGPIDESKLSGGKSIKNCMDGRYNKIPTMKGLYIMIGNNDYHTNPRIKVSSSSASTFRRNEDYTEIFMQTDKSSGKIEISIKGNLTIRQSDLNNVENFMKRNKDALFDNANGKIDDKELSRRIVGREIEYFEDGGR